MTIDAMVEQASISPDSTVNDSKPKAELLPGFDFFIEKLKLRLKKEYTAEQEEFASNFLIPTIVFANPGTGKTTSAVGGLLTTELFHKIPGENIVAASFTRDATRELEQRHEEACELLGIRQNVQFKTIDALCRRLLLDNYERLGFEELSIQQPLTVKEMSEFLIEAGQENNIVVNPDNVRNIVYAIRNLNAALIFDKEHVESKMTFKRCGMSYEDFTTLRSEAYHLNKILSSVQLQDIALYTLELLLKNPDISAACKEKFKVILVDEFQDMSLIKLQLLKMLTDTLVVIGDIKQQIYAFNGACQEIVVKYKEYFPDHREIEFPQSWRCKDEIASFATNLILANGDGGENFMGCGPGGSVEVKKGTDLEVIAKEIADNFIANRHTFPEKIMFLFRNNYSAIPIADSLFKYRVPFLLSKYKPAHQIPVIKDLCSIIELARSPHEPSRLEILNMLIPEFKKFRYNPYGSPLYKIMKEYNRNVFTANYNFREGDVGEAVMTTLSNLQKLLEERRPVRELLNEAYTIYKPLYLKYQERYLEYPADYYMKLVSPLLSDKTYEQFTRNELEKAEYIEECRQRNMGVRLMTLHRSKGTEADIVHIIDADEGIIPNSRKLEDTISRDCVIDAARDLRNERSLVYVGCTRAKTKLYLHHNSELANIFSAFNHYEHLDLAYKSYKPFHNDVEIFKTFCR